MKILVTGGTGVVGAGAIPELFSAGHGIRLLSRKAAEDAREYPSKLEPFPADVTEPASLAGAAEDCQAVIHITGVVDEIPPTLTYERVNVAGTANILHEARRSGVRRFIYLSSLGADAGASDYHRSKLRAEELVRSFPGEWVILRPGNVYGPGDEVISLLLKMVRTLPVMPVIEHGQHPFQPIWFQDLGQAITRALERPDMSGRVLELAGPDVTTTAELVRRLGAITGRNPHQVPVPKWLAEVGTTLADLFGGKKIASKAGLPLPINSSKLQMLLERNVLQSTNALTGVLGITPTTLNDGLTQLADGLPELLPEDGVGKLQRKRFWADIQGSRYSAAELIRVFRDHITDIMPIEFAAEPGAATSAERGVTLTGAIPGRGNIQVRVEEAAERSLTLATVEGHPLAGTVTFHAQEQGDFLRFTVEVHARASNIFDWVALRTVGAPMQNQNWKQVVKRVVELTGGDSEGTQSQSLALSEPDAEQVEQKIRAMVDRRRRAALENRV